MINDIFSDLLFSIIVPCYNQEKYIDDALESILTQTYSNWECILINDGSTDNTETVAKKWVNRDKRFKLYSKTNGGPSSARNYGIEKSEGKYILFLDPDDIIYSEYLLKASQFLKIKKCHLLICGFVTLNCNLSEVILKGQPNVTGKNFFDKLSEGPIAPIHSHLVSKDLLHQTGNFDMLLNSNEDWDLWVRIGKISNSVNTLKYTGVGYRMVQHSLSRNAKNFFHSSIEVAKRLRKNDERLDFNQLLSSKPIKPVITKYLLISCGTLIFAGKVKDACSMFQTAIETYNLNPSIEEYSYLFSYLSFTNGHSYKAKRTFYIKHIAAIAEFMAFCEDIFNKENLFANSTVYLTTSYLFPKDMSAIIPYISTKVIVYTGMKSLVRKAIRKISS